MKRKSVRSRDHLVWIDCEMTGLDPRKDVLLEIAVLITDNELNIIAEGPVLAIRQPESKLRAMNAWCRRTHSRSGLLKRVCEEGVPLRQAERQVLKFVRRYCYVRQSPLCGNSIWQDRRFLDKYMPQLDGFFHYQNIDVSSVKQLVNRWYPENRHAPEKESVHLALDDIRESVAELQFYKQNIFIV